MTTDENAAQVVVVGVDGSAESIAALGWAGRYAAATGATVRAVLAWHYPGAAGGPPVEKAPESVRRQTEQQIRDELDQAIAKVYPGASGDRPEPTLGYGHPAQVLIDESRRADLLVVGHRGHGGFRSMLVGSVSTHCVNHASCPVVVVRATA